MKAKPKRKITKRFYYKPRKTSNSIYGGGNYTADIFESKKGKLVKVGTTKWTTRSYKGSESEVYGKLVEKKKIPKRIIKAKAKTGGKGYYTYSDRDNHKLFIEKI